METYIVFFKSINIGGKHKVVMKDLVKLFFELGYTETKVFIQSGNILCKANIKKELLQKAIEKGFEKKFLFHSDVFVRTSKELEAIIAYNPFSVVDLSHVLVLFLSKNPEQKDMQVIRTGYTGPEIYDIYADEMYIYYTQGIGKSKFTNRYIEKVLHVSTTGRNMNTLMKIGNYCKIWSN